MKKFILITIFLCISGFLVYQYIFRKKTDIINTETNFSLNSAILDKDFLNNQESFNKKYLDKTIELTGTISEIDSASNAILIDNKVFATFNNKTETGFKLNQSVHIKGRLVGYDDLLEYFKFDQVYIINKK
jgi:regulatory protein YycI of two-component signal transduction system YycFG